MKIYFCGSIVGGREHLAVYQHIVERLQAAGHVVPTEHVAHPDVLAEESALTPRTVYERDVTWLLESDLMIAEVSTPSLGVGYEIACGVQQGIPVMCLFRQGISISKMITGNTAPNLEVRTYRNPAELDAHIDTFLNAGSPSSF